MEIVNATVVLLGQPGDKHIPGTAFMVWQRLTPRDWALADQPFLTPVVINVRYKNGVSYLQEGGKVQLIDGNPPERVESSPIAELSLLLARELRAVAYVAVGVNFSAFIEMTDAERFLSERFLRPGPWERGGVVPSALAMRLGYQEQHGSAQVSLEAGTAKKPTDREPRPGLVIGANYHTDIGERGFPAVEEAVAAFAQRAADFRDLADQLIGARVQS